MYFIRKRLQISNDKTKKTSMNKSQYRLFYFYSL